MGRRDKIHKRYRQKFNFKVTLQDSTSEKMNLLPTCINTDMKTPSVSNKSTSSVLRLMNNSVDRTPEFLLQESKKIECYNDMSPKINARLPKLKLNLDIPENDDIDINIEDERNYTIRPIENSQDLEKTLSVVFDSENENSTLSTIKEQDFVKCHSLGLKTSSELVDIPRKEITSLSGYFQIPSSTFSITSTLIEPKTSKFVFVSGLHKNNLAIENTHADNIKIDRLINTQNLYNDECCIAIEPDVELGIQNTIYNDHKVDSYWKPSSENITHVHLPVVSDYDSKTTVMDSHITVLHNVPPVYTVLSSKEKFFLFLNRLKSFTKITAFCNWFVGKCIVLIKKGYTGIKNLMSIIVANPDPSSLMESELIQVIDVIKSENNRVLFVLSEKIALLTIKLDKVRAGNEADLFSVTSEINKMQISNTQLLETTHNLTKELKLLHEKVNEIKISSTLESTAIVNSFALQSVPPLPPSHPPLLPSSGITISKGYLTVPPPPPPPPLPPLTPSFGLVPPLQNMKSFNSVTLNNKLDYQTPTKKSSTPLNNRPSITVEDLLKVTLKKAPQIPKDSRRNTVPGPRGPIISLDMLRNVKLKSARRRSLDQHKSPRSTSRLMRNRSQTNLSLSPVMLGAESSLSRILKPIDANRRVLRRIQSTTSNGEIDLSKDAPPSNCSVSSCKSESILM